jgi:hypothetical protein
MTAKGYLQNVTLLDPHPLVRLLVGMSAVTKMGQQSNSFQAGEQYVALAFGTRLCHMLRGFQHFSKPCSFHRQG